MSKLGNATWHICSVARSFYSPWLFPLSTIPMSTQVPNDADGASDRPKTPRASPTPNHMHPVSSPGKMDTDDVDASTVKTMHPAWANPLVDIQPGDHSDYEEPLRNYLENTPGPDEHGEWDIQKAQVWLEVGTVSVIDLYLSG